MQIMYNRAPSNPQSNSQMTKYDVTALGNALVDKEYQVSESFLASQGVEKGVMTLIEKDIQANLLDNLNKEHQLKKRAGGGSAANSMVTAAQFGAKTFYCCKVGDDELGSFYRQDLTDAKVAHRLNSQNTPGDTGKCVIMITDDAERTMCTYLGITSEFGLNELDEEALKASKYLYIEGHLVYSPDAVKAILKAKAIARENGVKVALTFSDPAVVKYAREHLDQVLGEEGVDLLFCNLDEARDFSNENSEELGIEKLSQLASTLVVTRGSQGASIYTEGQRIQIEPFSVHAVDTTGAGDTFAGAFLFGITNNLSAEQAGVLASRSAAECVSRFGPRLDKALQQQILREVLK